MMTFLVLFPKGGFKVGVTPITWGYVFLAVTAAPLLIVRLLSLPLRMNVSTVAAISMLVPMQVLFVYSYLVNGTNNPAYCFSTFVGLFALPWIFLLIYPPFLPFVNGDKLQRYLRVCMLGAALWGIFLFFWHPFTGHFIEIPYLTVNSADVGELENTKHIARGFFVKLIATYNNGNLYGVATLILLPLHDHFEPSKWRRGAIKVALLLTLSRTVWFGLLANELLPLMAQLSRQIKTFPVIYLGKAAKSFVAAAVTLALIFASLLFNGATVDFLLDPTAGGRTNNLISLSDATFLPTRPIYGFEETLYASALKYWGWTGLVAFTLFMVSPLLLLVLDSRALSSPIRRSALKGLILYMLLALSDGAFVFLPTMAFYWFVYMIYIYGWPAMEFRPKQLTYANTALPESGATA